MTNYKTIKISEDLHKRIKAFCDQEGLKLNQSCELWLEAQILYAIEYATSHSVLKNENLKGSQVNNVC